MTAAEIIQSARRDGLSLARSPAGTIRASGPQEAISRWKERLRQHKAEIVAMLETSAKPEGPPINRCSCGAPATYGFGWFVKSAERAKWLCGECYREGRSGVGHSP